jgi:MazG family protein
MPVDPTPAQPGRGLARLLDIVARLRGDDGCPWDREQTLDSLKPCLLEESYEVLEAIDKNDADGHREELGDLLLQVAMQCRLREEEGAFSFDDVAHEIADKLIRRHPHVFGNADASDTRAVLKNWEVIKTAEKSGERKSIMEGLPQNLPALHRAQRVQGRAARVGFDWDNVADVLAKVEEELAEIRAELPANNTARIEEELGDVLFAVVNLARFLNVSAEDALRKTIGKFTRRFAGVEQRILAEGRTLKDCTLAEMDAHWNAVKAEETG